MDDHRRHDTVSAAAERTQKQMELKEMQREFQQKIQEKQKQLQELEQAVNTVKKINRMSVEELLEKLEQDIADLNRRNTELEQLSLTEDHIHFLQSFQSLSVSSGSEDSSSISVHHHISFDGLRMSLSDLKERLEEFCREEFSQIPPQAAAAPSFLSEPKSREDFLQSHRHLILSEKNRVVEWSEDQCYPDHPERFEDLPQVLSVESLSGRCYWEVEWSGKVYMSVSYKEISRKGESYQCKFGRNDQSWSLLFYSSLIFSHNNIRTALPILPSSRIGVYVDHSAGILSFYSVCDTMILLYAVHTTFTRPLYAGFWVGYDSPLRLCDKNDGGDRG
ncbi:tripartite motif-containing protein 16-like isoform X2 [Pygocentrus nattereri]|uniref:tripartite motif-containing protein 16-like isoform X2 n=1 Tax=Pygocentrus nattereri TaxID=42514 RepID=UPI0018915C98|nr:tripartite motif-containing protein 16-like isoform X2 [Pygocentrus nattereri]